MDLTDQPYLADIPHHSHHSYLHEQHLDRLGLGLDALESGPGRLDSRRQILDRGEKGGELNRWSSSGDGELCGELCGT